MMRGRLLPFIARVVLVVGLLGLLLLMGRELASDPRLPLLVAGVILFIGLVAADPALVPIVCLPFLMVTARVGAGGVDLTIADALLAVAFVPSFLVLLGGVSRAMRQVLWLGVIYQVAALFTVIRNPYTANVVEWFHAGLLVLGAVIVGWALGRRGHAVLVLTLLVATSLLLAVITLVHATSQYAAGDLGRDAGALSGPLDRIGPFAGVGGGGNDDGMAQGGNALQVGEPLVQQCV